MPGTDRHIVFVEASPTGAGEESHRIAREKGCFVSLVTRRPGEYAAAVLRDVDRVVPCETNDLDALCEVIRRSDRERRIDGITTTADFYVPQAARAAEELGLPSLSYPAAAGVRNKYRMRESLQRACPELNPPFRLVRGFDEAREVAAQWGFPFIAKPQDANDSLNVQLIRGLDDLAAYMQAAASWDRNGAGQKMAPGVLLEGFIQGTELSVETMQAKGGEIQLIGVTQKFSVGEERGFFAEDGAYFPYRGPEADLLWRAVAKALAGLEIDCGVIHTELRIQDGRPKILEINPRLIGNKMGSHVIPRALGTSPVEAVVDIALGEDRPWRPARDGGAALKALWAPRAGLYRGVENIAELEAMPGVWYIDPTIPPGQTVGLPESNGDALIWIFTEGATGEEAVALADDAIRSARPRID